MTGELNVAMWTWRGYSKICAYGVVYRRPLAYILVYPIPEITQAFQHIFITSILQRYDCACFFFKYQTMCCYHGQIKAKWDNYIGQTERPHAGFLLGFTITVQLIIPSRTWKIAPLRNIPNKCLNLSVCILFVHASTQVWNTWHSSTCAP